MYVFYVENFLLRVNRVTLADHISHPFFDFPASTMLGLKWSFENLASIDILYILPDELREKSINKIILIKTDSVFNMLLQRQQQVGDLFEW